VLPSVAERLYLEEQQQRFFREQVESEELALSQAIALQGANAQLWAQHAGATENFEGNVIYQEKKYEIEAVEDGTNFPLEGDFGTVLSLVATLAVPKPQPNAFLWWKLQDSLDGENWSSLKAPGDSSSFRICTSAHPSATVRLMVPVAQRLRIAFEIRSSNQFEAPRLSSVTIFDVALRLGLKAPALSG
jgi:hypothetical protein